ncbi:MAG: hypothetical protein QOI06_242 [Nocardioidaceae bacterium]|jgi:hypothetical protein|nr:hypothetical protein [Nocardioidaceae bacterium]
MNESSPTHGALFGTTTNPCPAWCTEAPGHGYDTTDKFGQWEFRYHSRTFPAAGTEGVDLTQGERLWPDGTLELESPAINLPEVMRSPGLDGQEARGVAVALCAAADRWDEINAAGGSS